jgi:chorismate mutase
MERTDYSQQLGEVELLIQEIRKIKSENKTIFDQVRERQMQIGMIFRENPAVKSIYRFQRLMDAIDNGQHFGHYGRAIARAKWLGRLRETNPEETEKILGCFRSETRTPIPFLTVGYRRVWYVAVDPGNKSTQALILALKELYYRAKKQREEEDR